MPDFTRLRLIWEPRMLSISRIMLGLLFMEHGTAKVLDFPHQETHKVFDLLTLNPGAQGLVELIGGFLFALGLFTPTGRVHPRRRCRGRLFHGARAEGLFPAAQRRRAGDRVLFRLPLFLAGRRWRMEPRPAVRERTCGPQTPYAEAPPWAVRRVSADTPQDAAPVAGRETIARGDATRR